MKDWLKGNATTIMVFTMTALVIPVTMFSISAWIDARIDTKLQRIMDEVEKRVPRADWVAWTNERETRLTEIRQRQDDDRNELKALEKLFSEHAMAQTQSVTDMKVTIAEILTILRDRYPVKPLGGSSFP